MARSKAWFSVVMALGLVPAWVFADSQTLVVTQPDAPIYDTTDPDAYPVSKLKQGQKVLTDGTQQDGLYKLTTKSGKDLWISTQDVKPDGAAAGTGSAKTRRQKKSDSFERVTFDLGGSTGNSGGSSFYEIHLGVNYYILRWLVWRNAPFYRVPNGSTAVYGLDSSLQGKVDLSISKDFAPNLNLGAGYRLANDEQSAPFIEGGLGLKVKNVSVQASVKYLFNSVTQAGLANQKIYTLSFSGSGGF